MRALDRVAVVGVDLGPTGDDAILDGLHLLADGVVDQLHLLHVVNGVDRRDEEALFEAEAHALGVAPLALEARAQVLARDAGISATQAQIHGHGRLGEPVATLLQMCVDFDADLLVVGTHGRRGIDRWVAGSVAERLVRDARCPVLVARPKDYAGLERTRLPDPAYKPGEQPVVQHERTHGAHESTTISSWSPSDNGPTGFRIV